MEAEKMDSLQIWAKITSSRSDRKAVAEPGMEHVSPSPLP